MLFGRTQERVSLCFPFLFAALLYVEWKILGGLIFGNSWLIAFSLLAAIHHLFTIAIIARTHSILERIRTISGGRVFLFWAVVAATGIILFLLFAISLKNLSVYPFWVEVFLYGFLVFSFFFVSTFHMIQQSKGISLLYNKALLKEGSLKPQSVAVLKITDSLERTSSLVMVVAVSIGAYCMNSRSIKSQISPEAEILEFVGPFSLLVAALAAGVYIFSCVYATRVAGIGKAIFSLRMAVWPFYPVSLAAQAIVKTVHGLEYYFIFRKISDHSEDRPKKNFWNLLLAFFLVYALFLTLRRGGMLHYFSGPKLLYEKIAGLELWVLASATYGAVNIIHIGFDSLIFRTSQKNAQPGTIEPLIRQPDQGS